MDLSKRLKELTRLILPRRLWVFLRGRRDDFIFGVRRLFELSGYNVSRRQDGYSPLPVVSELARTAPRWNRPSELPGLRYDLEAIEATLAGLLDQHQDEFRRHPSPADVKARGFGPGFPALDALTLYSMIREYKPAHYLEVGSGVSTYYCHLAAAENEREGRPTRITCIEPNPYEKLRTLPWIELWEKQVQDVPITRFEALRANDVLFIDSSHILRIDGDVPYLFLEALPRLAPGVLVHVHDVPFPFNVPHPAERWVLEPCWPMFWNEAMILQAFLAYNESFEILVSTPLVRHFDEEFLKKRVLHYETVAENPDTFSSIWLRKVR